MLALRLPQRFRNRRFLRRAFLWLAPATIGVVCVVAAPQAWIGALLFLVSAAAGTFYVVAWRRVDLKVLSDNVVVGGVFRSHAIAWGDIREFEIMSPSRRTPFRVVFRPWTLPASVRLTDGAVLRVGAIDPRQSLRPLTYFGMVAPTTADQIVDWLNQLSRAHSTQP